MTEVDHLFRLVPEPGPVVEALERAGFVLDAGNRHVGQGTRNRRLLFGRTFFEVLWIDDAEGARTNVLRLDTRVVPGRASVGVCFRGDVVEAFGERCWTYRPPYAPMMSIHVRRDEAVEPLHFGFEAKTSEAREALWPSRRLPGSPELFAHANGARELAAWRLEGDSLVLTVEGLREAVDLPGVVRFEPEQRVNERNRHA